MPGTNKFDKSILKIIELHSYDFYIITRNLDIICSCINHETDQADPKCKKCLGTGRKITIRKGRGAAQDSKIPSTFRTTDLISSRSYFLPYVYSMKEDDLIVDNNEVYLAHEIQKLIAFKGKIPYSRISCVKKKFDSKIFLRNFYEIIRRSRKW